MPDKTFIQTEFLIPAHQGIPIISQSSKFIYSHIFIKNETKQIKQLGLASSWDISI